MELDPAVLGIHAQEEANRRSLAAGLSAQKTIGEIAAQPVDMAYKQSLTRVHTADADKSEEDARAAKASRDLQLQFLTARREEQARLQLSEAAAKQGKIATVGDLPPGGSIVKASQADELEAFANYASKTMPPMELAKLRGDIAEIKRKEAAEAASLAAAGVNEHKQQVAQFEQIGNIAGAAGASEANYRAIMMSPQRQLLPKELTGNWRMDAPVLKAIEQASQDSIKRANLQRQQIDTEARRRLANARMSESAARIKNLEITGKTLERDYEQQTKAYGKYSREALKAKQLKAENTKSLIIARNIKNIPLLSLDGEDVMLGQIYTAANGQLVRAIGTRPDGKPRLEIYDDPADDPLQDDSLVPEEDDSLTPEEDGVDYAE